MKILLISFVFLSAIASNASQLKNVNGTLVKDNLSYFFQVPETFKVTDKDDYIFITEESNENDSIGILFVYSQKRFELTSKIDNLKNHTQNTCKLIDWKITPIGKTTVSPWFGDIWHVEGPAMPKHIYYFLSWDPYGVMVMSSSGFVKEAERILKTIKLKYQIQ